MMDMSNATMIPTNEYRDLIELSTRVAVLRDRLLSRAESTTAIGGLTREESAIARLFGFKLVLDIDARNAETRKKEREKLLKGGE